MVNDNFFDKEQIPAAVIQQQKIISDDSPSPKQKSDDQKQDKKQNEGEFFDLRMNATMDST
jgi:hypothetical protein